MTWFVGRGRPPLCDTCEGTGDRAAVQGAGSSGRHAGRSSEKIVPAKYLSRTRATAATKFYRQYNCSLWGRAVDIFVCDVWAAVAAARAAISVGNGQMVLDVTREYYMSAGHILILNDILCGPLIY